MINDHFEDYSSQYIGNAALNSYGGAIEVYQTKYSLISSSIFSKNCADFCSGAMDICGSHLDIEDLLVEGKMLCFKNK
jgi:hypothetical protein